MINTRPNVSVIIPTFNRAHLLGRALQSVLDQTYQDFEIIIMDDASTDNTNETVAGYKDERIKYIRHPINKGGGATRNTGIKEARGTFIAFLDSDDEWLPQKLERQIQYFSMFSDSVGLVYCLYYVNYDTFGYVRKSLPSHMRRGNVYRQLLRGWCPATTSSVMIRTSVFDKSGTFDESLPSFQDYDLWIRIAKYYEFEFISDLLMIKHEHSGSQIAKDLEPRIRGLELFADKWKTFIKEEAGEKTYDNIIRKYYSIVYSNATIESLINLHRMDAIKYLKKMLGVRGISLKIIAKCLLALFGGKKLFSIAMRKF